MLHTGRVNLFVVEPTFCCFAFCSNRMKYSIARLLILACCFATACQRPYALYQRTPPTTYRQLNTPSANAPADTINWAALVLDSTETPISEPAAYASTRSAAPATMHQNRVVQLLTKNRVPAAAPDQTQPKPKPRNQAEPQRKTLREILGLKPRPKLNWWQRISWRLKASVIVILVAVVFAILHITILAIIFGLIGAFLLIKGLKKSFKVRRPLF